MFTSMTARVLTNTYCLDRTWRRRSENSVGRVTHECEVPMDTVQLVKTNQYFSYNYNLFVKHAYSFQEAASTCLTKLVSEKSLVVSPFFRAI